jgi:hypothetical protein
MGHKRVFQPVISIDLIFPSSFLHKKLDMTLGLEGIDICFIPCYSIKRKTGGNAMSTVMEKEEAHKLIDRMAPNATWDDLMREIYVREAIERGLADSKTGRTKDVKEVRAKYGLPDGLKKPIDIHILEL